MSTEPKHWIVFGQLVMLVQSCAEVSQGLELVAGESVEKLEVLSSTLANITSDNGNLVTPAHDPKPGE